MEPTLTVFFFKTETGTEPVRNWLRELPAQDRRQIGEDIKTVQYGWPLGMPLVKPLRDGIWEVRVSLENRIARILFAANQGEMILLHGFIKKSRATPKADIDLAVTRLKQYRRR